MTPRYGQGKLDEGAKYLSYVRDRLIPYGITFWSYDSPLFQLKGESLQGCEVKLDNRCIETGRLSIEVEEKSHRDMPVWTASGIRKSDNSWAYIQGNYELIFLFSKKWLIRYQDEKRPKVDESHGTVRKFYLPMKIALIGCVFAVDGNGQRVA